MPPDPPHELVAPVAVRAVDLDHPADLTLVRDGAPYRSALLLGLRGGVPIGASSTILSASGALAAEAVSSPL